MDFSNESRNLQIANYLQTLRLEQNMTLEQLSDKSHVPIVHLTSIEDGRFTRFDDFYLKMYLKKYTQALGINLEQLYAYAMQQPIEDIPKQQKEEPVTTVVNPDSIQDKVQSQPTAIETPSRKKPPIKRSMPPSTSLLGPNYQKFNTSPHLNLGRILIGLFLVGLVIAFLFVLISFFRNMVRREDAPIDLPPVLELPEDINFDTNSGEDDQANDGEVEETELESEPTEETTIELDGRTGQTQTFTVVTSRNEIELRMEHHSGPNWIGAFLNGIEFINTTYYQGDTLEEAFTIENADVLRLTAGAIQAVEAIFINGVEIEFLSDGLIGAENLDFIITIQSE